MRMMVDFLRQIPLTIVHCGKGCGVLRVLVLLMIVGAMAVVALCSLADPEVLKADESPSVGADRHAERIATVSTAVRRFIERAEKGEVNKVAVHYRAWNSYTSSPMSEQDLMISPADCEVVLRGWALEDPVRMLVRGLRNYPLKEPVMASSYPPDFAMCVVYYCGEEEVLRIGIAKTPPVVSVNGEHLRAGPQVVYPLTWLLPSPVREDMFSHMILAWVSSSHEGDKGEFPISGGSK